MTETDQKGSAPVDAEIGRLAAEYMGALGLHKDRDCHWSVAKKWSYGEFVGYFIEHPGYIYEVGEYGEMGPFSTYEAASRAMVTEMRKALEHAKGICW